MPGPMLRHLIFSVIFVLSAVGLASELGASAFPPRNRCIDIPGKVRCLKEHGGLIHGAEITTPELTLTCRAFRRFWLQRFAQVEGREIVVAGVCETRDRKGDLIAVWNTLDPLQTTNIQRDLWDSALASLPGPVVEVELVYGNLYTIYTGYYLPQGWDGKASGDHSKPGDYDDFPRGGPIQAWTEEPARASSVESPRFDDNATHCGPGFVVCSAYLKIFYPAILGNGAEGQSSRISVEMVSARRFFSFTPGILKIFEYSAEFLRREF